MKRFTIYLIALYTILGLANDGFTKNKSKSEKITLANASFEKDSSSYEGWHKPEELARRFAIDAVLDRPGHSGKNSVKLTQASGYRKTCLQQLIPTEGNQAYAIKCWYKTDPNSSFILSFMAYDSFGNEYQKGNAEFKSTDDWKQAKYSFNLGPDAREIAIQLGSRKGTSWCDDVEINTTESFKTYSALSDKDKAEWEKFKPKTRVLNNLVTELIKISGEDLNKKDEITFVNPKQGWIYVSSKAKIESDQNLEIHIPSSKAEQPVIEHSKDSDASLETMQYLAAGRHTIEIKKDEDVQLQQLIVRVIPEIWIAEYESEYSTRAKWMAERNYLHKNANTTVENFFRHVQKDRWSPRLPDPNSAKRMEAWRKEGKRALLHLPLITMIADKLLLEFTPLYFKTSIGLGPLMDGIVIDEIGSEYDPLDLYLETLKDINSDPKFSDKGIYIYTFANWECKKESRPIKHFLAENNGILAPEYYLEESPSLTEAKHNIRKNLLLPLRSLAYDVPGSINNTIATICICSLNYFGSNCHPTADFKVFLDYQFNALANDTDLNGLGGIGGWIARYADDETLLWFDSLLRHYCIEGNRTLLSEKYGYTYNLEYIKNPDFSYALTHWQVKPASPGSIRAESFRGYGHSRGTRAGSPWGDHFVTFNGSTMAANKISQSMTGLKPGQLYSVKMYTSDKRNLFGHKIPEEHQINVSFEGAKALPDKYNRLVYNSNDVYGKKIAENIITYNYHEWFFIAESDTAELTIYDKKFENDETPHELILNFIEIQPYYDGK